MPALSNPKHERFAQAYYVYLLVDPRTDTAFYVGKGKGRRAWSHQRAERGGRERNGKKAEVLGQLRRAGLEAAVHIVKDGLTEREAFKLERDLIRRDAATLTNISMGCRTAMESVQAAAREDLWRIKPLCQMWRERASPERMAAWAWVVAGLGRIVQKAA